MVDRAVTGHRGAADRRVCQRGVERRDRGHLAAAFGAASVARGEAGVDLDDQRAARRCGIERPDGHAARKAVEHAHARKARFADLRRAGEVEVAIRSEEHTSELQSLMRISSAVLCMKKKKNNKNKRKKQ